MSFIDIKIFQAVNKFHDTKITYIVLTSHALLFHRQRSILSAPWKQILTAPFVEKIQKLFPPKLQWKWKEWQNVKCTPQCNKTGGLEIIIISGRKWRRKTEWDCQRRAIDSTRLVADSPWTEAADRTTNCTLGNINGHAVGHDGREADVSSCRKSRVCRPTKRIIFVSRQLARKHVVEYVPVKGNMRFWKTFRVFLPSFDGGRVHSPTQVGQDE